MKVIRCCDGIPAGIPSILGKTNGFSRGQGLGENKESEIRDYGKNVLP